MYMLVKMLVWICPMLFLVPSLHAQRNSIIHDNLKRTFKIHTPQFYDSSIKLPLVIALHGRGGNGESMILITRNGFNDLADEDGFIVVYPNGIGTMEEWMRKLTIVHTGKTLMMSDSYLH